MGRYAKYFKGNEILPIPEIAEKIIPRFLSLVVSDLKTKRLVGLSKDTFEELLRKAGIPCQYFSRKSFATWDVLLPTEQQAAKAATNDIVTKYFRLQPEYKGTRRLRVTVCNVPAIITGEVLAAYLRSPAGTAYWDYAFRLCLTRDGFKAIPETLVCGDRQMMVMVEGRRSRCWGCKQIGHITKFCPQRPENKEKASVTTTTKDAAATTINKETEAQGPGQVQHKNNQEGWTEVTRKRRGYPKKGGKSILIPSSKTNKGPTSSSSSNTRTTSNTDSSNSETSSITDNINSHPKDTSRSSTSSIPQKEQKENQTKPARGHGDKYKHEEEKRQWGRGRQKNMP